MLPFHRVLPCERPREATFRPCRDAAPACDRLPAPAETNGFVQPLDTCSEIRTAPRPARTLSRGRGPRPAAGRASPHQRRAADLAIGRPERLALEEPGADVRRPRL